MDTPIVKNGKILLLAYDQGFEHGPTDFTDESVDPEHILTIAKDSGVYSGIVFHEGIAQSYLTNQIDVPPLVLKLNGKTAFHGNEEPYSPQLTSVAEAIRLHAKAIGYTIYIGSEYEGKMMQEFSRIEDEAHSNGLSVLLWAYPRGKHVEGKETSKDVVSYAARLGLELGADFVKLPYTGDKESFSWVVKSAGKTGIILQGGAKTTKDEFFSHVQDALSVGAVGVAVGRNIWQSDDPIGISKELGDIVYGK